MKLETYHWEPGQEAQRCQHEDCFSCPYPDCIASVRRIRELENMEREKREQEGDHGQSNLPDGR